MSDYADDFEEDQRESRTPPDAPVVPAGSSVGADGETTTSLLVTVATRPEGDPQFTAATQPPPAVGASPTGKQPSTNQDCQTEPYISEVAVERDHLVTIGGATYRVGGTRPPSAMGSRGNNGRLGRLSRASCARPHCEAPTRDHIHHELRKIELVEGLTSLAQLGSSSGPVAKASASRPSATAGIPDKNNTRPRDQADGPTPMSMFLTNDAAGIEQVERESRLVPDFADAATRSVCGAACYGDVEGVVKLIDQQCATIGCDRYAAANAAGYVTVNRNRYGLKKTGTSYTVGVGGKATPLQFACAMGHAAVVRSLLDMGAKDATNIDGSRSLPEASKIAKANGFQAIGMIFETARKRRAGRCKPTTTNVVVSAESGVAGGADTSAVAGPPEVSVVLPVSEHIQPPISDLPAKQGHIELPSSFVVVPNLGHIPAPMAEGNKDETSPVKPPAPAAEASPNPVVSSSSDDFESDSSDD